MRVVTLSGGNQNLHIESSVDFTKELIGDAEDIERAGARVTA